jgi:hypothetical protein
LPRARRKKRKKRITCKGLINIQVFQDLHVKSKVLTLIFPDGPALGCYWTTYAGLMRY